MDWSALQKEANRSQSSDESTRNKSEEEAKMISFLLIFIALVSLGLNSCSMLCNHTALKSQLNDASKISKCKRFVWKTVAE